MQQRIGSQSPGDADGFTCDFNLVLCEVLLLLDLDWVVIFVLFWPVSHILGWSQTQSVSETETWALCMLDSLSTVLSIRPELQLLRQLGVKQRP